MRGDEGQEASLTSLCTLYEVLLNVTVLMAPLTPFISELIYQNLARALPDGHAMKAKSVHFVMIPDPDLEMLDEKIVLAIKRMSSVVEIGRLSRERRKVGLKMPLKSMKIMTPNEEFSKDIKKLQQYIQEELNVEEVTYSTDTSIMFLAAALNFPALGRKLGKDMPVVKAATEKLTQDELRELEKTGEITICGHKISGEEISLQRKVKDLGDPNLEVADDNDTVIILDFTYDEALAEVALMREIRTRVQKARKDAKLLQDDPVDMWLEVPAGEAGSDLIAKVVRQKRSDLDKLLRRPLWMFDEMQGHECPVFKQESELETSQGAGKLVVHLTVRGPYFNTKTMRELTGGDVVVEACCRQYLQTFGVEKLSQIAGGEQAVKVCFDGKTYSLKPGEHFSMGPAEAPWMKR
jgi:isoleucyl-tRNA synthetase